MTTEARKRLRVDLSRWAASCVILLGFMFYRPMIPLIPALIAITGTFVVILWRALYTKQ